MSKREPSLLPPESGPPPLPPWAVAVLSLVVLLVLLVLVSVVISLEWP